MNELILTINTLQQYSSKYNISELQLPQIVVVGSQSSGKSSVMERIIGYDILPKAAKVATRCPIILQLIYDSTVSGDIIGIFAGNTTRYFGPVEIGEQIQLKTNKIGPDQGVVSEPIILQLRSIHLPTLTLIDLPGIIKNDGELPAGSKEKILGLSREYTLKEHSIILAISAANVDLANSDSIAIAKEFDPDGKRTLNVITKIDLMDKGTSVIDILNSALLKNSLGKICVINRSQESVTNKKTILATNKEERDFLDANSQEIPGKHGVEELIVKLVTRLDEEIRNNIPTIEDIIRKRIDTLKTELKNESVDDKYSIIHKTLTTFVDEYRKIVAGKRDHYKNVLTGGSLISIALYEDFEKRIKQIQGTKRTKDSIKVLMKNTIGNRRTTFSVEEPFVIWIREEIDHFLSPSLRCNEEVKNYLNEFVTEIIKELSLEKYKNFSSRIETDMFDFIEKKHLFTKECIDNIIRGEKEDIFYLRPNTDMFASLKGQFDGKMELLKSKAFENIAEKVMASASLMLPPNIRTLLFIANSTGILGTLKDVFAQGSQDSTNIARVGPHPTIRPAITVPVPLLDTINSITADLEERKSIFQYLTNEKKLPAIVDQISEKTKSWVEDSGENMDETVLEEMVKNYFEVVRKNIICNVPKWIQTVFIKDLLHDMDDALHGIREDPHVDELLSIDPAEAQRIHRKREELEELEVIATDLTNIRRRR